MLVNDSILDELNRRLDMTETDFDALVCVWERSSLAEVMHGQGRAEAKNFFIPLRQLSNQAHSLAECTYITRSVIACERSVCGRICAAPVPAHHRAWRRGGAWPSQTRQGRRRHNPELQQDESPANCVVNPATIEGHCGSVRVELSNTAAARNPPRDIAIRLWVPVCVCSALLTCLGAGREASKNIPD